MFNPQQPIIHTKRLQLRPLAEQHRSLIIALYTCPQLMRYMQVEPFSLSQAESYFNRCLTITQQAEPKGLIHILHHTALQIPIGLVCCYNLNLTKGETETGAMLLAEHQGQGLATEAYQALLPYLFEQLQLKRLKASYEMVNQASVALYHSLGFQPLPAHHEALTSSELTRQSWLQQRSTSGYVAPETER